MTTTDPVHTETETHKWSVNVPNHPQRADSPEYTAAKNKMNEIAAQLDFRSFTLSRSALGWVMSDK